MVYHKCYASAHSATMPTNAIVVEVITRPGAAHSVGSPDLDKPLPWTSIRPFILERELSNYPNKAFVRRLINNLRHGCAIGYAGPQFMYFANNLHSASQLPEIIDTTLKDECRTGRILGPFHHQTFVPLV